MNISIITGSVREGRQTHKAANYIADMLEKRGVTVNLIDLASDPLPVYGFGPDQNKQSDERIASAGRKLDEGDAIILVTPEYHGSFSGVLKNALDHFTPEFRRKPVGVIATSAGRMGGINASNQLQHVILSMGAYPVPLKFLVPQIHAVFDEPSGPDQEKMARMAARFLDEFLWFTDAIRQKHLSTTKKEEVTA